MTEEKSVHKYVLTKADVANVARGRVSRRYELWWWITVVVVIAAFLVGAGLRSMEVGALILAVALVAMCALYLGTFRVFRRVRTALMKELQEAGVVEGPYAAPEVDVEKTA